MARRDVLCVLVLLALFASGNAMRCYTCTGIKGQNNVCDPVVPASISGGSTTGTTPAENCMSTDYICAKYTTRNQQGQETIERGCKSRSICTDLTAQNTESRKLVQCNTCSDVDLCNSSGKLEVSLGIVIGALVLYNCL